MSSYNSLLSVIVENVLSLLVVLVEESSDWWSVYVDWIPFKIPFRNCGGVCHLSSKFFILPCLLSYMFVVCEQVRK